MNLIRQIFLNCKYLIIFFLYWTAIAIPFYSLSQVQEDIFPDKKGDELLALLVSQYKTNTVLSYKAARDQLWAALAKRNHDSLRCVYTGYAIYLNPNSTDPSGDAYNKNINCEHTWPQSLGAEGNAKSDMHHLYPTREDVNSARGNLPFADIPDNLTVYWFRLDKKLSSKPVSKIEEYSEIDNGNWFEPREDHKGNVARAMIYFYTMYKGQSDANFFKKQLQTFYQWHYLDPPDDEEIWRNNFIASKQEGKPNPFILDSTLIRRAYFPQYKGQTTAEQENFQHVELMINGQLFTFNFCDEGMKKIEIIDLQGKILYTNSIRDRNNPVTYTFSQPKSKLLLVRLCGEKECLIQKIFLP